MGRTRRLSLTPGRRHDSRPYKLVVTSDPNLTLGEGRIRHYPSLLAAANAFVKDPSAYKQIVYDDGHCARELDEREEALLERVCWMLGYELDEIEQ